ncbi:PAS domain S-box protein [Candidatus Roizmanbacteria bacterium]|nr:MAG: PAS domain S-box protein [Candidatus Roizmanbacteria bacterium]
MGQHDGIEFIKKARHLCTSPFILLTGIQDEKLGIEAIRLGAEDYLVKSEITPELLERSILYAIERFQSKTKEQEIIQQRTLERSERHYRSLIENSADGIALMNTKFKLTYVTPSIETILGYTPEQILTINSTYNHLS